MNEKLALNHCKVFTMTYVLCTENVAYSIRYMCILLCADSCIAYMEFSNALLNFQCLLLLFFSVLLPCTKLILAYTKEKIR